MHRRLRRLTDRAEGQLELGLTLVVPVTTAAAWSPWPFQAWWGVPLNKTIPRPVRAPGPIAWFGRMIRGRSAYEQAKYEPLHLGIGPAELFWLRRRGRGPLERWSVYQRDPIADCDVDLRLPGASLHRTLLVNGDPWSIRNEHAADLDLALTGTR